MPQRRIEFDAQSLLRLLTHYFQDHELGMPVGAELVSAGVSPYINRWIMLEVKSDEWNEGNVPVDPVTGQPEFLHLRYEGRKTASWQGGDPTKPVMMWDDAVEAPNK